MTEEQADKVLDAIGLIAQKAIKDVDALLIDSAGFEPRMKFFMAFLERLIEERALIDAD